MAPTKLTTGQNTTTASSYKTSNFAPGSGQLVLAFVTSKGTGATAGGLLTATGHGLTWVQVASLALAAAPRLRITCFRAMGMAPVAGVLTFDFGGLPQDLCAWSVFEYSNIDQSGSNGSGAIVQSVTNSGTGTNLTVQLGPLADPAASTVAGGIVLAASTAAPIPVIAGTGLAQIDQQTFVKGGKGSTLQTEDRPGGGQIVDWRWTGANAAAGIAVEIKAQPIFIGLPPDDPESLALRFEPILFFHPSERFFPSDAKRYVEQCALWKAEAPFDVKDSWGGKGTSFPRSPLIDRGKIAAAVGEPGTPLSPQHVGDKEELFFDLAGWKDPSGAPQPAVTASSQNVYSNRDHAAELYNGKLRESRFWYHAEFFEHDRLRQHLESPQPPDLRKVLDSLENAALLCYYFFYPAHDEQPVEANVSLLVTDPPTFKPCTNVEGKEFNCFSGEWACLSILLQRKDPAGDFRPTHLGYTGRLMSDGLDRSAAIDVDNSSKGLMMTVSRFDDPMVRRVKDHAQLFVANGTHAFYLTGGVNAQLRYPDDSKPYWCGLEGPPKPVPAPDIPDENPLHGGAIVIAKTAAGWSLGPWGAIVGFIAGVVEYIEGDYGGFAGVATGIDPNPPTANDTTGLPGPTAGKVVRPKGVTVPTAGADVQDWMSQQGFVGPDGRRYDFIVDLNSQLWWPESVGGGYHGRWGPRVETDPFDRRAGMKFPDFSRLFFLAFARGKAQGEL